MKNKSIMIYAYTKFNLGDDLFIQFLCSRYPDVVFHLYTYPEYRKVFYQLKNLIIHSNHSLISKATNLFGKLTGRINQYEKTIAKKCDACVCITGSLFIQKNEEWLSYFEYMKSRKITDVPFFLIGSNFGPYSDPKYFEAFYSLFAQYEDICFREKYSYELFNTLPNVRYAPDVLLQIGRDIEKKKTSEKYIVISVINTSSRLELELYSEKYKKTILEIIRYYAKTGFAIKILSFCKEEGDHLFAEKVLEECKDMKVQIDHCCYCDGYGLSDFLELISRSDTVIATRFHAMILGWALHKRTLPIIYSDKMKHVIDDFEYQGSVIDIRELGASDDKPIQVFLDELDVFDVSKPAEEAVKQFTKLDEFLG